MKPPLRLVLRDLAVAGVVVAAWAGETRLVGESGPGYDAYRVLVGLLTVVCGALLHEWGHLTGSLAAGSVVHYPPRLLSKLLFDFDVARNSSSQFLWMNLGGYVSIVVALGAVAIWLPIDRLAGQVALAGTAFGTLLVFIIEMPATIKVLRGGEPPAALVTNYPDAKFPEPPAGA